jgi:Holliday junction DNA helicase RuvB
MDERIIDQNIQHDDSPFDRTLRPKSLLNYIGQPKVKDWLSIGMKAAKQRSEPLEHFLLYGPPGLGKTTLALLVGHEMDVPVKVTSGPAIERPGELAAILTSLDENGILFIDEIHRLSRVVEEVLYPAIEDFAIDIVIGKGPTSKSLRLNLKPFTLIGATTRFAMVSAPLRDRFGSVHRLEFYDADALKEILFRSAELLKLNFHDEGLKAIAIRSRGTPRIANRLLRRVRDFAEVKADGVITSEIAAEALRRLEVDNLGLDNVDYKVLSAIIEKFNGGPVGIETIAASISEEADTVRDVYEPYLMQMGFIERTSRGRLATSLAYKHLGLQDLRSNNSNESLQFPLENLK